MPPKVDRCVQDILARKTFKPKLSPKERESSAWAICYAAQKNENADVLNTLSDLPPDVTFDVDESGTIVLSEVDDYKFEDDPEFSEADPRMDIFADDNTSKYYTFSEIDMTKKEKDGASCEDDDLLELEVLREGNFSHPRYGDLNFGKKYFMNAIQNFTNDVLGREISFDSRHQPLEGATAWVKKLGIKRRMFRDRKIRHVLTAGVDLTDWGKSLVDGKRFKYFSSEVDNYIDAETGKEWGPTMMGGGLTNRPFITGMRAIEMSEDIDYGSTSNIGSAEPGTTGVKLDVHSGSQPQLDRGKEAQSPRQQSQQQSTDNTLLSELDKVILAAREEQARPPDSQLPDMAFALVKRADGKVVDRALPHHGPQVKSPTENSSVDIGRLRNALARINQVKGYSAEEIAAAQRHLEAHAKELLKTRKETASRASTDNEVKEMEELKEQIATLEARIASLDGKDSDLAAALQEHLESLKKQEEVFQVKLEEMQNGVKSEFETKLEEQHARFEAQNNTIKALQDNISRYEEERRQTKVNARCDALINVEGHYPAAVNALRELALSQDSADFVIKLSSDGTEKSYDFMDAMEKVLNAIPNEGRVELGETLKHNQKTLPTKPDDFPEGGEEGVVQLGEASVNLLDDERFEKMLAKAGVKPAN